jgi:hypothetical protein
MLNLIKPGHVLRFGTCPSTIISPSWSGVAHKSAQQWPAGSQNLGNVSCISHPSGALAEICAHVATGLRTGGNAATRAMSYSKVGNFVRQEITKNQNVQVGASVADFVGYTDGYTNYIQSANMVFSKDFSGCLMVVYTINGARYVAHAAANANAAMDCKQAFLTHLQQQNAQLVGWFRPYSDAIDGAGKAASFQRVKDFIQQNINKLTTFGAVWGTQAYSIEAFKPTGVGGNDWVVTNIVAKPMSQSWIV